MNEETRDELIRYYEELEISADFIKTKDINNLYVAKQIIEGYNFGKEILREHKKALLQSILNNQSLDMGQHGSLEALLKQLEKIGLSEQEVYGTMINLGVNGNVLPYTGYGYGKLLKSSSKVKEMAEYKDVIETKVNDITISIVAVINNLTEEDAQKLANEFREIGIDEKLINEKDIKNIYIAKMLVDMYDFKGVEVDKRALIQSIVKDKNLDKGKTTRLVGLIRNLMEIGLSEQEIYGTVINLGVNGKVIGENGYDYTKLLGNSSLVLLGLSKYKDSIETEVSQETLKRAEFNNVRVENVEKIKEEYEQLGMSTEFIEKIDVRNLHTARQILDGYNFGRELSNHEKLSILKAMLSEAMFSQVEAQKQPKLIDLVDGLRQIGLTDTEVYGTVINLSVNGKVINKSGYNYEKLLSSKKKVAELSKYKEQIETKVTEDTIEKAETAEYINSIKRNRKKVKTISQEGILKILKVRDTWDELVKTGHVLIWELEKKLDKESVRKIIDENGKFGYTQSKLMQFVMEIKDIEFLDEQIPKIFKGNTAEEKIIIANHLADNCPSWSTDFVKRIIEQRDKYGLTSKQIRKMIPVTYDEKFILECMENPGKYGVDESIVEELIENVNYPKYIAQKYNMDFSEGFDESKKINLPNNMTIGIEIEAMGLASKKMVYANYDMGTFVEGAEEWEVTIDESLNDKVDEYTTTVSGVEVISPVLRSGSENEIHEICTFLQKCKLYGNNRTGGHIHIGADYLENNVEAWKKLIEIWANTENILYLISNKEGEAPRDVEKFASPVSKEIAEVAKQGGFQQENFEEFIARVKEVQGTDREEKAKRYASINFQNVGNPAKNTIEFRLANGTVDQRTWIENINLFGGLMVASKELTEIEEKVGNGQEITEAENEKIKAYETIMSLENNDKNAEAKLQALMLLAINEEDRHIYLNRYAVNRRLIADRKIVEEVGIVRLSKKQVGRLAFTGENPINGVDYEQAQQIIENMMSRGIEDKSMQLHA